MSIPDFIKKQPVERREILSQIHQIVINSDKQVVPEIGTMMGKEMIIYKAGGFFKYGLSSVKNHMSLHIMPIYGSTHLHSKYENLLSKAKFQKGCINFNNADDMPPEIVKQLMDDSAKIDLVAMMEKFKKKPELKKF